MGVAETVRVSRKGSAGLTYRRIRQSGHCLAEAVWKSAAQGLESGKQPASQPSQAQGTCSEPRSESNLRLCGAGRQKRGVERSVMGCQGEGPGPGGAVGAQGRGLGGDFGFSR